MTGDDVRKESPLGTVFEGLDIISGPIIEAFLLQNQTKTVLLLDEFMQVHLYPDTSEHQADFAASAASLNFPVRVGIPGKRALMGHQLTHNPELSPRHVGYPTWTVALPAHEEIKTLIPSKRGPVASTGRVLGDRSTLYKYLNPHIMVMTTASPAASPPTCGIYLVDTVKGSVIYNAVLPSSAGTCDVKATFTENWLVYEYFDGEGEAKGHRVVSVEFYEGSQIDDKIKRYDFATLSLSKC